MRVFLSTILMLVSAACRAVAGEGERELLRAWTNGTTSVEQRAIAVRACFTNGCPISLVVTLLGTNYTIVHVFDGTLESFYHPELHVTDNKEAIAYAFGKDEVTIFTSAPLGADPLRHKFTRVGYTAQTAEGIQCVFADGQPGGAANRSQPVGAETNRTPATAGSDR